MTILIVALTAFWGHYQVAPSVVEVEAIWSHLHCRLTILEREPNRLRAAQRIEKVKYVGCGQAYRQLLSGV
jgi:hypothetical protein